MMDGFFAALKNEGRESLVKNGSTKSFLDWAEQSFTPHWTLRPIPVSQKNIINISYQI